MDRRPSLLVLQHIACEPPGAYEDELLERGGSLTRVPPPPGGAGRVLRHGGRAHRCGDPGMDGLAVDRQSMHWLVARRSSSSTAVFRWISHLGDPLTLVVLALVSVLWLSRRRTRIAACAPALALLGASITETVAKQVFGRPGPRRLPAPRGDGPLVPVGPRHQGHGPGVGVALIAAPSLRTRAARSRRSRGPRCWPRWSGCPGWTWGCTGSATWSAGWLLGTAWAIGACSSMPCGRSAGRAPPPLGHVGGGACSSRRSENVVGWWRVSSSRPPSASAIDRATASPMPRRHRCRGPLEHPLGVERPDGCALVGHVDGDAARRRGGSRRVTVPVPWRRALSIRTSSTSSIDARCAARSSRRRPWHDRRGGPPRRRAAASGLASRATASCERDLARPVGIESRATPAGARWCSSRSRSPAPPSSTARRRVRCRLAVLELEPQRGDRGAQLVGHVGAELALRWRASCTVRARLRRARRTGRRSRRCPTAGGASSAALADARSPARPGRVRGSARTPGQPGADEPGQAERREPGGGHHEPRRPGAPVGVGSAAR